MNRYRFLALTLCLILLCGCGTTAPDTAAPADPPEDAQTDQITPEDAAPLPCGLAYDSGATLNPYNTRSLTNRVFLPLCYESLYTISADYAAVPLLAADCAVSEDEKTYTITLRSGVTFSDGTPLTATDAANALLTAKNTVYYGSRLRRLASATAADAQTLVLTLSTPSQYFTLLLDVPIVKTGTAADEIPVGTGPYTIAASLDALEPNDHWWQTRQTVFNGQTIPLMAAGTAEALRAAFESDQISLVCVDPNTTGAAVYHRDYELWNRPTNILVYLGFNPQRTLFSSQTVRSAVTHAIDRTALVQEQFGSFAVAATLPASLLSPFYDESLAAQYDYDPDAAKALAQPAGTEPGVFLVCSEDPTQVQLAQALCETLNAAGLPLEVKAVEQSNFQTILRAGSYDLYLGQVRLTADFDLRPFFSGELSYGGIGSTELNDLSAAALENEGNYYDLHRAVMTQAPFCPLLFKSYAVYTTRGAISNLTPGPGDVFFAVPEPS